MSLQDKPNNVIKLDAFKRKKRQDFLMRNRGRLDAFFASFISRHFQIGYDIFNAQYIEMKRHENELAWDYNDFRDDLGEAIKSVYGPVLWAELKREFWFEPRCLSYDNAIERCLREFILTRDNPNAGMAFES